MKEKKKSKLDQLKNDGIICSYARFHQPVPPTVNKDPVSEFRTERKGLTDKYLVESLWYTAEGLIWESNKELNIIPLANVIYVRT